MNLSFYKDKVVLITGHTGFKGTWMSKILINAGAKVIGYSLEPQTQPNLFKMAMVEDSMISIIGDIRDYLHLKKVFEMYNPDCVVHMAAQPIVRESYINPRYTYEVNVMGTVNVCECVRLTESVKSFLNVTTDKVYLNDEKENHSFTEDEPLDGYDPYSNSKSCSELVTHSYLKSFFSKTDCSVSTARAGNVIGGGDFSKDRIIPDCVRATEKGMTIVVRNPNSIRPYQHVLEPLFVYLDIVQRQYKNKKYEGYYNVGPDECDCVNTGELVEKYCSLMNNMSWTNESIEGPHEALYLRLDNTKIKKVFGWMPRWHIDECMSKVVEFTKVYLKDKSAIPQEMEREINDFLRGSNE